MAGQPSGGQIATPDPNSVAGANMAQQYVNGFPVTTVNAATPTCTLKTVGSVPVNNVSAPVAGVGGDKWGAYGGAQTPVGNGVTGVTGWDPRVSERVCDGQTPANYEVNPIPIAKHFRGPTQSVQTQTSTGAVRNDSKDTSLTAGGSNQG